MKPTIGATAIKLPAQLDLRAATSLKESLLPFLVAGQAVAIDASEVKQVSTACAQILASFVLSAKRSSISVSLLAASAQFTQAMCLLGLSSVLGEPSQ
jgi:anti-anti-sigma regulatory factor